MTWGSFDKIWTKHVEEAKSGFARIDKLEAEVHGDPVTGRPSLRETLMDEIQTVKTESERQINGARAELTNNLEMVKDEFKSDLETTSVRLTKSLDETAARLTDSMKRTRRATWWIGAAAATLLVTIIVELWHFATQLAEKLASTVH